MPKDPGYGTEASTAMSSFCTRLVPRAAFGRVAHASPGACGVLARDRDGLGIAAVLARRERNEALAQQVRERLGFELPCGPYRVSAGEVALAGIGPGTWLATRERSCNLCAPWLMSELGGLASISDQSDGYAVLGLTGSRVREALVKLVPIDLDPRVFRTGAVAVTVIAHIGATLWRLEDGPEGHLSFEISVYRSLAASLWSAVFDSAAEFGCERA